MSRRAQVHALALLVGALGCEGESRSDVACVFGDDNPIASARGGFGAVRVTESRGGIVAAWTSSEGTFIRAIDEAGRPSGDARRVGSTCDLGLDVTSAGDGLALACLHGPIPAADKKGLISVVEIDGDGRVTRRRTFGELSVGSRGVSIAARGSGDLAVAYFDGERGAVFFVELGDGPKPEPRVVSREGPTAGPPDLYVDGDRYLLTWAETIIDPMADTLVGEVVISDLEAEPVRFASVLYDDAQPMITRDGEGLVIGFRDENPAGSRIGLFTARVGPGLEKDGNVHRIGRSDAESGIALFPCADGLYAIAPHSYSRREMLVGVHRLDGYLSSIAGERQIYTSGARYEHGTGTCADGAALVLVAERAHTPSAEAVLKGMTLRCER